MTKIKGVFLAGKFPRCIGVLMLAGMLCGCRPPDRFTYEHIHGQYGDPRCAQEAGDDDALLKKADTSDGACTLQAPLTIQEALDIALKNNPDLHQARFRIRQAKAMTDLSKAAFWPAVGFYTEYMQGDAPSSYLFKKIDQRMLPADVNFNDPGWFENFETGLNARMNLFNGGRDYLALRMAEKDESVSALDRQAIQNELMAQVIGSFYNTLAAREFIDTTRASVDTMAEQLRIMRVRFEGGGALKSDVLSLEVRLAQAREDLLSSENRHNLSWEALAHLMGFNPAALDADADILTQSFMETPALPDSYADGLIYALDHRPELARIRAQLIQSRMGLDAARAGYLPRLDLMGKYYLDDPNLDYDPDRENWNAALMFNWDFFTGFSTPAAVRKAEANVRELLAADRKTGLAIRLDVRTAYLNYEEAKARYQVAVSAVDSAAESFRLVKNHYEGGSVTITRFLEAELDLSRARIRSTAAFYDKIKAEADIARAIGLWSSRQ